MTELWSYPFIRYALVAGLTLAVTFGTLSFFVVVKRLSFLTVGIAHAAFAGVALGIFIGTSPYLTSVVFCLAVAWLIRSRSEESGGGYDATTGILFAATMALGIVLLSIRKSYSFDLSGYLFGSILGMTARDTLLIAAVSGAVLITFGLLFRKLLFVAFDPEVAQTAGVPVRALESLIVAAVTLLVVVSIKMVGIILVTALLVLPAAFAMKRCADYRCALLVAVLFSIVIFLCGFGLSLWLDLPTGGSIVLLGTLIYLLVPARRSGSSGRSFFRRK